MTTAPDTKKPSDAHYRAAGQTSPDMKTAKRTAAAMSTDTAAAIRRLARLEMRLDLLIAQVRMTAGGSVQ